MLVAARARAGSRILCMPVQPEEVERRRPRAQLRRQKGQEEQEEQEEQVNLARCKVAALLHLHRAMEQHRKWTHLQHHLHRSRRLPPRPQTLGQTTSGCPARARERTICHRPLPSRRRAQVARAVHRRRRGLCIHQEDQKEEEESRRGQGRERLPTQEGAQGEAFHTTPIFFVFPMPSFSDMILFAGVG